MKILFLNVLHWLKKKEVMDFLKENINADVICLQEADWEQLDEIGDYLGNKFNVFRNKKPIVNSKSYYYLGTLFKKRNRYRVMGEKHYELALRWFGQ